MTLNRVTGHGSLKEVYPLVNVAIEAMAVLMVDFPIQNMVMSHSFLC